MELFVLLSTSCFNYILLILVEGAMMYNWADGQPVNYKECAVFSGIHQEWKATSCNERHFYICTAGVFLFDNIIFFKQTENSYLEPYLLGLHCILQCLCSI